MARKEALALYTWKHELTLHNAAAVLQRAVQLNSLPENPRARYGSKLYAFVYKDKSNQKCVQMLEKLGYTVMVRDIPVDEPLFHIKGGKFNRPLILNEPLGPLEFLKLRLYELIQHPVVVYLDLDTLLLRPLDELFDAIVLPAESPGGAAARKHLVDEELIAPTFDPPLPPQIDAFYTKDWCAAKPRFYKWVGVKRVAFWWHDQVLMYSGATKQLFGKATILGRGAGSGWGSSGYGRQIYGSMVIQGLLAYYYDVVNQTGVELHRCKFNLMADNPRETVNAKYPRASPVDPVAAGYSDGKCRDGRANCDDVQCQTWPLEDSRSIHFTNCLKPWVCPDPVMWKNTVVERNCRKLHGEWFRIRADVEGHRGKGAFEPEIFLGFVIVLVQRGTFPCPQIERD